MDIPCRKRLDARTLGFVTEVYTNVLRQTVAMPCV